MGKIKYPPELRLKIVLEYLEGNMGYVALSQKYNVASPRDIAKWVAMYKEHGEAGLCTTHGTYDGQFKIFVEAKKSRAATAAHGIFSSYFVFINKSPTSL